MTSMPPVKMMLDPIDIPSLEALSTFAKTFLDQLRPGDTVFLIGEMGAGKTALVSAMVGHFSDAAVSSPTFSLIQVYDTTPLIVHMDLYRLNPGDIPALDLDRYWEDPQAIKLIEWPERLGEWAPALPVWRVEITRNGDGRTVRVERPRPT